MSDEKFPEITEEDFFDIDFSEEQDDPKAFDVAREKLERRCSEAGIELESKHDPILDEYLLVKLPSGRETRARMLADVEDIEEFLSVPFGRYTVLGSYQAICSYEDGTIEALIAPLARALPVRILLARLVGRPVSSRNLEAEAVIGTQTLQRSCPR